MIDFHVLGTSGSRPTGSRSVSGNYLSTPSGSIVIDCGEGFQDRLVKHDLDLKKNPIGIRARISKIKAILLTHSHLDHCWGVLPFLKTMQLDGRIKPLTIIGPTTKEAIDWVEDNYGNPIPPESGINPSDFSILFREWKSHLENSSNQNKFPIEWILIPVDGYDPIQLLSQPLPNVHLSAIPTIHGVTSVGWLISIGGSISKRILISGDTTKNVPSFNKSSLNGPLDLLIHEATFTSELSEKAEKHGHSTALDAAKAALDTNTNTLGMVHFSPRIKDIEIHENEARKVHLRSMACQDGDIFRIKNDDNIILMRKNKNSWFEHDSLRT
jgi:ribonuclease Z